MIEYDVFGHTHFARVASKSLTETAAPPQSWNYSETRVMIRWVNKKVC